MDSHIYLLRPRNDELIDYLGITLIGGFQDYFSKLGSGTTGQQRLHSKIIIETFIPVPPQELLTEFTKRISPLREELLNLCIKDAF